MRMLTYAICLLFVFGCSSKNDKKADSDSSNTVVEQPAKLEPIEPAVPEPKPSEKKPFALKKGEMIEAGTGIDFNINLPEGYQFSRQENLEGVRVSANEDRFVMDIYIDENDGSGIHEYWQNNPKDFTFRQWIINSEDGVLVEVEREGKAEFHVDYVFRWKDKSYRLTSGFDKSFSQYDASQMFNVCRMLKGLNQ